MLIKIIHGCILNQDPLLTLNLCATRGDIAYLKTTNLMHTRTSKSLRRQRILAGLSETSLSHQCGNNTQNHKKQGLIYFTDILTSYTDSGK